MNTKRILMSLISLFLFAGCVYDTDQPDNGSGSSVVAQFTADILGVPTRATDDHWDDGDEVGVFMVKPGTTNIVDSTMNKHYKIPNSSNYELRPADDERPIYLPADGRAVDFIAYYPYRRKEEIANLSSPYTVDVSGDQSKEGRLAEIDLLYARTASRYDLTSPMIKFTFAHKLTKLNVNIRVDVPIDANRLKVFLLGAKTKCVFDLETGEFVGTPTEVDTIILHEAAGDDSYKQFEAIVVPQAGTLDRIRTINFEWTENGTTIRRSIDLPPTQEWLSGMRYEYTISLSKTATTIGENELDEWTTDGKVNVCYVTYDANDETENTLKIPWFIGGSYPLDSFPFPTSPNLIFLGWTKNETGDGNETLYHPGEEFQCSENTTLYAQWAEKYTFYVHRDGNDAASSLNTPPKTVMEAIAPLKTVAEAIRRIRNANTDVLPTDTVPSILIWGEVDEDNVTFRADTRKIRLRGTFNLPRKIRLRGKNGTLKALTTPITIHSVVSLEDGLTLTNVGQFGVDARAFSAVKVETEGTLELSGSGVIAGSGYVANLMDLTVGGGSVRVNGGTFTMSGGSVEWNQFGGSGTDAGAANFGGGVYVENGGKFYMSGGTIKSKAQFYGGGVFVYLNGTFHKTGGTINATSRYGADAAVICVNDESSVYGAGHGSGYVCYRVSGESDKLYYPLTQGNGSPEANGWNSDSW